MRTGFDITEIPMTLRPGRPWLVPQGMPFWWRDHLMRHAPGGYTDGMSSPQFTHIVADVEPFGWAGFPAIAHDAGYHGAVEMWVPDHGGVPGHWRAFPMFKDECDTMFLELLQSVAETTERQVEALAFYEAVRLGGQSSYDEGHKKS